MNIWKGKIHNNNKEVIDSYEFNHLNNNEQYSKLNEILTKLYEQDIKISNYYLDKVILLSYSENDKSVRLPKNLIVKKVNNNLVFKFKYTRLFKNILTYIVCLFIIVVVCSYIGINNNFTGQKVDESCNQVCDITEKCDIDSGEGGTIELNTLSLKIHYVNSEGLTVDNIVPSDTEGFEIENYEFSLTNPTDATLSYTLKWMVYENTFVSTNLKYKIESTNNGYKQNWTTYPTSSSIIATDVRIKPNTTQSYKVSSILKGENESQNYDQDKRFMGKITATAVRKAID